MSVSTASGLESLDFEHLPTAIVSTRGAGDVRRHVRAALRAALEDGCTPASCATAHFLAAFGLASFWYCHGFVSLSFVLEVLEDVESRPSVITLGAGQSG